MAPNIPDTICNSYMLFLKAQKISEFDKVVLVKAVGMFSGSIFDYTFRGLGPSGSKQNPMGTCFYDCYEKKAYTGLAIWWWNCETPSSQYPSFLA